MSAPNPIQDQIKTYLAAHPWFSSPSAVPVFCQDEGDLANKLAAALGDLAGGLAIVIATPSGVNRQPDSARVCLESTLEIQCRENPLINRGPGGLGKTAYTAARVLAAPFASASRGLHDWKPEGPGLGALAFQNYTAENAPDSGELLYNVRYTFSEVIA